MLALPEKKISATRPLVGRKAKGFTDKVLGRFPAGTFARIAAVLREGEDRTAFLQKAVENELKRRSG